MNILFVRHGETDWNVLGKIQGSSDTSLNENGKNQAYLLANNLKDSKISKIFSSKQLRALETAIIVGERLNIPVEVLDGLQEINMGSFEGLTWKEAKEFKDYDNWENNKFEVGAPGNGESYKEVLERFFDAFDKAIEKLQNANSDILFLTHSGLILILLSIKNDYDFKDSYKYLDIPNANPVVLSLEEIENIRRKVI